MSWCGGVLTFLLAVVSLHLAAGVAVMSVDLGSEWMKIAVVSVSYYFLVNRKRNVNSALLRWMIRRSDVVQ